VLLVGTICETSCRSRAGLRHQQFIEIVVAGKSSHLPGAEREDHKACGMIGDVDLLHQTSTIGAVRNMVMPETNMVSPIISAL